MKKSDIFTFPVVKKSRKSRFQRKNISLCYENVDYVGKCIE